MRWSTKRILTTPHLKPPITFKGRTKRPNEWAEETGVPGRVLTERLRRGWSLTRALETPVLDKDEVAARARAGRKPRTHCKRGHSLKDAPNYGRGRVCLPCNRMRGAKWRNKS